MEFLNYIIQSSLVIALFLGVYWLLLRRETHFTVNRHFLLTGMLVALLLPFVEITRIIKIVRQPVLESQAIYPVTQLPLSGDPTMTSLFSWEYLLTVIYSIGLMVFLIRFARELFSLGKLIRGGKHRRIERFTYVEVKVNVEPFSFFNYIVFNPGRHQPEELVIILEHERSHVGQWHTIDLFCANLIRMAFWFNPLAWSYRRAVEENLEFLADRSTQETVESPHAYQLALVKASTSRELPLFTNPFYQSSVKKRIVMLNKQKSPKINLLKTILVLPGLALVLWSFNVKEVITYVDPPTTEFDKENPPSAEGMPQLDTTVPISTKPKSEENLASNLQTETTSAVKRSAAAHERVQRPAIGSPATALVPQTPSNSATFTLVTSSARTDNGITIRITANTTESELKDYQRDLGEKDITMDYSDLQYNQDGKLTGIKLSVKSETGNGNYHVNSDEPISEILIRISEEGMTIGSPAQSYRRAMASQERAMARAKELEARQAERYKERLAMAEARQYEMQARKAEGYKERAAMAEARQMEQQQRMAERELAMVQRQKEMSRRMEEARAMGYSGSGAVVWTGDNYRGHETLRPDMSEAELKDLQRKLATKGVTMNYKKVKRNDRGEITGIKVTVERGGSNSSTSVRSDDDEPIEPIRIKY
jgi:hypothetical protein